MQKRFGILICLGLLLLAIQPARGQFREEAFSQQYNDDADTLGRDSTDVMFSFKDYFGGLRHKKEAKIGTMFAGSTLFVGGQQVYNRQYWKLPVIYGGLAATAGLGIHYRHRYNDGGSDHDKLMSNLMFAGTGLSDGQSAPARARHPVFHPASRTGTGLQRRILEDPPLLHRYDRIGQSSDNQQHQLPALQADPQ